jgi:outer membrane receptor protein involved in Fe transport
LRAAQRHNAPRSPFLRPHPAHRERLAALLFVLCCVATAGVVAQPTLPPPARIEEVIVTAELRDVPWLEYSGSSSIATTADIRQRAAVHLENLLLTAPNVNLAGGSSRARFFQLRGIGERSQFVEPLNPSVGLLLDDVDFSGLGTVATLYDIEQVEVLRGPQGTLHGANALAGLISLRSAAPTAAPTAHLLAGAGDYGREELGATLSGPLLPERLLGRLAAYRHRSDGFMRNDYLGRDDTNGRDEQLLRGRLRWLVDERQQLDVTLMGADSDNGYDAFSLDNTRNTLSDQPGRDRQRSRALAAHWQTDGEHLRAELLGSAADSDSEYSYDEDWSYPGIAPGLEYASFDRYLRQRRSYSAQLRLGSSQPLYLASRALDWVAGIYLLDDDEQLRREYTYLDADFHSHFRARSSAVFGQMDMDLGDGWGLSAGLRLASRDMTYRDSNGVRSDPDNQLWGGKLALHYDHERFGHVYAALSRGYRAGGVNAGILAFPRDSSTAATTLDEQAFFDQELLYNLELGHKGRFAGGRLLSALTLFYMDRRDQQVRGSLVLPREDGSTAFVDFTDNAASGRNLGLEWELRLRPADAVDAYLNLGLLRADFDRYTNADGRDLAGRDQAHAPHYQFATGLNLQLAPRWTAGIQYEGRDGFYFSDRHDSRARAFELLHLRLAYRTARWSIALWSRNALDEEYSIRGFGSFGNDPRKGYAVEEYRQLGDPRQLGVSFELSL